MAERRWTDEQLSAIENRDRTLLVSAAAGSGKTATLTERIIRSLMDEQNPIDIDSLLVVTFTNAAAAELRAKISAALTDAVKRNPDSARLKRQLYLLPSAKIRTIDSFCNEILRQNCDRVGVPYGYRIADTAECELLAISIIEGMIEAAYNGEMADIIAPTELEELADCLTDVKSTEALAETFRYIHLKCDSAEEGIELLSKLTRRYSDTDKAVEENTYGAYLMKQLFDMTEHYITVFSRYEKRFSAANVNEAKLLAVIESDLDLLKCLNSAKSYESAREIILSYELMRKPAIRKDKTADMESFGALRDMMRDDLKDMKYNFRYTTAMWQELFANLHRLLTALYRFEREFDRLFTEEKRRRGALSYADIERYTYKCLIQDGEPTDIAKNIAARFGAVYIDEYQDVNALQNRIFEVISRPENRFMVGDIKQSIYGFRSACPEIFASMKRSFPPLEKSKQECASIFMSKNFRCDKAVVDFVNNIFDRAFDLVSESIGYSEGDRLGYAKIQPDGEPEYRYPEVCMVDKPLDDEDPIEPEEVVASKISELLCGARLNNGAPVRPSDIAIILRNARGKDNKYAEALERRGIPSCIAGAQDFFLSSEVLLALCLLNSIDNPRRDVYLAGLMCSPLFDFTAEDLCNIKKNKAETLYESLVMYVNDNQEFTKGADFLKKMRYYRAISEGVGVDTLIYKLYRETGLLALASNSGGRDNLMLLYDYARDYEAGSFKGLYNFINFINNIIDKKTTFDDAREGGNRDAVKIVTCHASKGLEYPVVFLVSADGRIYNKDRASRLAFSEDFGISFRLRTKSGLAVVENPVQDMINCYIENKLYEEELRVLYVALTRARERLYVVGKTPLISRTEYEEKLEILRENLSEYSFRRLDSYQEIILVCEGSKALSVDEFTRISVKKSEDKKEDSGILPRVDKEVLCDELTRRFSYSYVQPYLTDLPEKMSVSKLHPAVLDGSDADAVIISGAEEEESRKTLPSFAIGTEADESAKKGIATHLFMQFCDLESLANNGSVAELERLFRDGYLSADDKSRVRIKEIDMFKKSNLYIKMRSAKKIYRELRFNVRLPASQFTEDDARKAAYHNRDVLVQGVIDCVIINDDDSITLCDYKTDRLTREEKSNRELAENKLRAKHENQLKLYALALEKMFGTDPKELEIYSLPLGDSVKIK